MPQSKFTELCSSAAVLLQSKFTSCVVRQPLCHKVNLPNSFCQQVDDWMLLKITEKIIRRNVFEERKRIPG